MKLLLVEDNTAMQTTLVRSFERRGVQVVVYRLRKKLAGSAVELVTLRGLGYLLRLVEPAADGPGPAGPA